MGNPGRLSTLPALVVKRCNWKALWESKNWGQEGEEREEESQAKGQGASRIGCATFAGVAEREKGKGNIREACRIGSAIYAGMEKEGRVKQTKGKCQKSHRIRSAAMRGRAPFLRLFLLLLSLLGTRSQAVHFQFLAIEHSVKIIDRKPHPVLESFSVSFFFKSKKRIYYSCK